MLIELPDHRQHICGESDRRLLDDTSDESDLMNRYHHQESPRLQQPNSYGTNQQAYIGRYCHTTVLPEIII